MNDKTLSGIEMHIHGLNADLDNCISVLEDCKSYLESFQSEWKEGEELLWCKVTSILDRINPKKYL